MLTSYSNNNGSAMRICDRGSGGVKIAPRMKMMMMAVEIFQMAVIFQIVQIQDICI